MRALHVLALSLLSAVVLATASKADVPSKSYTPEAFAAAQAANQPILVDVTASWCPTCRAQAKVMESLFKAGDRFKDLVILKVDYDTQRDVVREFRAPRQSTLIVYRGAKETGRAVAITGRREIESLLASAYPQ
jgi:thioredoxin 1